MVDSELWGGSVGVGGEVAAGVADLLVVPQAGGERQQSQADAGGDAERGAAAVTLEREGVLERVDDRLDPLADAAEVAEAGWLVLAGAPGGVRATGEHEAV